MSLITCTCDITLIAICDTMSSISLVILVSRASSSLPSGNAVLLATPQLGHTHSNDLVIYQNQLKNYDVHVHHHYYYIHVLLYIYLIAICLLASGVQSSEPIVPLPSVGMKPTKANNIVRTNRMRKRERG